MPGSPDAPPRDRARRAAPRRRHFRANLAGRDFVVGDLHGCREVLLALRYGRPVVAFLGGAAPPPDWPRVPVAATLDELAALVDAALGRRVS